MKALKALAFVAAMTAAGPAFSQTLGGGGCITDLTLGAGSNIINCYGRYSGNELNNASNSDINAALTALGYAGPAITYSAIPAGNILSGLNGNTSVNFPGLLNGTVYFGVHYGNGQGGPGNSTTFYKIFATNLDIITLNLGASSTATLFAQVANPVPEPATWAMMLAGFGAVGFALRRRERVRANVSFA